MSRLVDLTLPLAPGMRGVEITSKCTLADTGWNASTFHLYSHAGTHMDAQVHFEAGLETVDQLPLSRCMGMAWVVDLPGIAPRSLIEVAHLGEVQDKFRGGEGLLFRTGWSRHANNPALYRDGLPRISEELARWCVARQVKLLGVEPPSVADVNNLPELARVHEILLRGGVTIVEGLCHLDQLGEPRVYFVALPLRIVGGDGCPCRAFAVEGNDAAEQLARLLT